MWRVTCDCCCCSRGKERESPRGGHLFQKSTSRKSPFHAKPGHAPSFSTSNPTGGRGNGRNVIRKSRHIRRRKYFGVPGTAISETPGGGSLRCRSGPHCSPGVETVLGCSGDRWRTKMASWEQLGEVGTVGQLMGVDAVRLIGMIVQAANTARMHKKNCRQFAQHLKMIGNLLEQLKISELKRYPETREPLEQLEDALRRSYVLVNSCQDRSYLYLLAMGWSIVYQFRKAQTEIDRYLRLVPLITLVDNARVRERLECIERDQREYTLDEEDRKVQDAILNHDPSQNDTMVLKKTLSCSYPNLPFDKALRKENEKLQLELQRSQANLDVGQCEVIQHLLGVTETIASSLPEKNPQLQNTVKSEEHGSDDENTKEHNFGRSHASPIPSGHDLISTKESFQHEEWHSDLLDCCSEPSLCIKTFFYPCGTFSKIASVAKSRHISSAEVCNDLMAYTLVLSCCCYTCFVRRSLRQLLNIKGGLFDDFLSHMMCCCCALVQEWREVEIRGIHGPEKTKTSPPTFQYMES